MYSSLNCQKVSSVFILPTYMARIELHFVNMELKGAARVSFTSSHDWELKQRRRRATTTQTAQKQ